MQQDTPVLDLIAEIYQGKTSVRKPPYLLYPLFLAAVEFELKQMETNTLYLCLNSFIEL